MMQVISSAPTPTPRVSGMSVAGIANIDPNMTEIAAPVVLCVDMSK